MSNICPKTKKECWSFECAKTPNHEFNCLLLQPAQFQPTLQSDSVDAEALTFEQYARKYYADEFKDVDWSEFKPNEDFRAEYRAYLRGFASKVKPVNESWIPVEKELPRLNTTVLCYVEEQKIQVSGYMVLDTNNNQKYWITDSKGIVFPVTHWRILPNPPKI